YAHLLYALDPQRTLVTVHDIAPLRFPGYTLGLSQLSWMIAWRALKRACQIVTVSRFTASELLMYLQGRIVKMYVVPNGVDEAFHRQPEEVIHQTRSRYQDLGEHLLLHVGHTHARKNLSVLIRAVKLLRSQGLQVGLIQVGGCPGKELFNLIVDEQGMSNWVRFVGLIDDAQLVALYSAVDAFVFPSLYEGFGLPVLEAMACGAPVIASNVASLPEVVGDAGILVDPTDVTALADAIWRALMDVELRERLRQQGLMRAREFSWQRCAQNTLAVYQQIIRDSKRQIV
ncbi:MAG: glycosyltransferase family 4 protein, partial [Anaerolineae bacterium]